MNNVSNSIPTFSPINPIFVSGVWERIAIDLIGPMPRNEDEFSYILVPIVGEYKAQLFKI